MTDESGREAEHNAKMRLLSAAMICSILSLAACSDASERQKKEAAQSAEELALMRDAAKAGAQIDARLRRRIRLYESVILVKEEFGDLHAMPATVGWSATCGLGGLGVSIAAAGQENGLQVSISDAFLEEQDCLRLLPLTAAKVTDLLAGK
jgi:hypothetical protein